MQIRLDDVRHDETGTQGQRLVYRGDGIADKALKLMQGFLVMRFARRGGAAKSMAEIVNSRHAVSLPINETAGYR